MKSKLTLRIRSDVKALAKAIATETGKYVSCLVETYFQMPSEKASQPPSQVARKRQRRPMRRWRQAYQRATQQAYSPPEYRRFKRLSVPQPLLPVTPDEDTTLQGGHA
jgi:hypothetical protein